LSFIAFAVILSPFPLPIPFPTTLGSTSPVSSFPVEDHLVGTATLDGLPPSIIKGARRRNLRFARGSAESVCLRADHYLHHVEDHWGGTPSVRARRITYDWRAAAPTLFVFVLIATCTMARQHLTPSLPPHSRPSPAPHSHLCFGYKQPVLGVSLGFAPTAAKDRVTPTAAKDRVTPHIHSTPTRRGKVYKRALVVPQPSPHQRSFVCGACIGTAQVGVLLVSLFNALFERSMLHCFDICLT